VTPLVSAASAAQFAQLGGLLKTRSTWDGVFLSISQH